VSDAQPIDANEIVKSMLAAAGLPASAYEIEALVEAYPDHKLGVESLYAVADARYESPAFVFSANPTLADWG
jgi:hypothetical protein